MFQNIIIQTNCWRLLMLIVVTLLFSLMAFAKETYIEEIHYEKIEPQIETTNKNKIEVIELFWYGCPHCHNLEPYVTRWLKHKSKDIEFIRIPAIFRPGWEVYARAFYTAESLGIVDRFHPAIFGAIHGEKRKISTEKSFTAFFAELGIVDKRFVKVFRSLEIGKKVKKARELTLRYGIRGVPAIIINGEYRTGKRLVTNGTELFEVVNYLTSLVKRKE